MTSISIPTSTTRPSITEPDDIIKFIQEMPDREFRKLLNIRFNIPRQRARPESSNSDASDVDYDQYSEDFLIEEIALALATTKEKVIVNYAGLQQQQALVSKYYKQAEYLKYKIPIYQPTPVFTIDIADLDDRLIAELYALDDPKYILRQAVGRIFENIDDRYYHLAIAKLLDVNLVNSEGGRQ
ncbi:MAG TPA: hypothetical protein VJ729_16525 [Nitrososphaeraceae archaeon]|nr:hypothetical protein [Nitrososphaeraceae archaeon]